MAKYAMICSVVLTVVMRGFAKHGRVMSDGIVAVNAAVQSINQSIKQNNLG